MTTLTLRFTFTEIRSSLEKMGYELKEEEVQAYGVYKHEEGFKMKTWMAYFAGLNVTESGYFSGLYGTERVERLFEKELCKKLLELF